MRQRKNQMPGDHTFNRCESQIRAVWPRHDQALISRRASVPCAHGDHRISVRAAQSERCVSVKQSAYAVSTSTRRRAMFTPDRSNDTRRTTFFIFAALPAQVYMMYAPDVWGRSASDRLSSGEATLDKDPSGTLARRVFLPHQLSTPPQQNLPKIGRSADVPGLDSWV